MSYSNAIARLCFVAVCIFFSGCHRDDDPAMSQALLTLQANAIYNGGASDDGWVFATDENGELLDVKPYRVGQTVTLLPTTRVDKINVTFFVHSISGYFSFETWAAVPSGTTLHLEKVEGTSPPSADDENTATFKVSSYPGTSGQFGISTGVFTGYSSFSESGNLGATLEFSGAPADVLLYGYRSGELVYNWANGVKSNDVITRDYVRDFAPFQHQTQLNFEGYNVFQIIGRSANRPFPVVVFNSAIESDGHPMIGYMGGFDNYTLSITNFNANGKTTYYQDGADLDLGFGLPAYTFSLKDNHIQNFSFDFSADYTYYTSVWKQIDDQERSSAWTVYAPAGQSIKALSIPSEITTQYPQLSETEFTYSYTTFTKVIKGWSYLDLVPGARKKEPNGTMNEGYVYAPNAN